MSANETWPPVRPPAGRDWLLAAIGLSIGIFIPALGLLDWIAPNDALADRALRQGVWLLVGIGVIVWVSYGERQPLASIGLKRPTTGTFGWGLATAVALIASLMLCYAVLFPLFGLTQDMKRTGSIIDNPGWLQAWIFLNAGFVEEIIFRGYLIERVQWLSGGVVVAFLASVIAFTLIHLSSWAPSQLLVVSFGAVILAGVYCWKRDLVMVMFAHALADAVGFALASFQR